MTMLVNPTLRREFKALHVAILALDGTLQGLATKNGADQSPGGERKRKVRLSAKAHASMVLQGRYMGYMRQLKPRQKAQVRKIREVKGMRVAIAKAMVLARAHR